MAAGFAATYRPPYLFLGNETNSYSVTHVDYVITESPVGLNFAHLRESCPVRLRIHERSVNVVIAEPNVSLHT